MDLIQLTFTGRVGFDATIRNINDQMAVSANVAVSEPAK